MASILLSVGKQYILKFYKTDRVQWSILLQSMLIKKSTLGVELMEDLLRESILGMALQAS